MWAKWFPLLLSFTMVKSDMSHENFQQYMNYALPDMDTICSYFRTAQNVSQVCAEQLEIVCRNATLLMTMLDASSKFPYTGLGYSSRMDYGNFDQCLTIDHRYEGGRILGEHCVGGLILPDLINNSTDYDSLFKLALCRPNACLASDLNAIIEDLLETPLGIFFDGSCQTVESNTTWSTGDIAVLTVFLVVIGLMILSTIYDIYLYKTGSKSIHPLLVAFSVLTNGRKLLHISKHSTSKEQIEVFHGLRVISMMWIIAGHAMVALESVAIWNVQKTVEWQQTMYSLYITTGPLAVDTFFFMSGFLLAFQYFKGKARTLVDQLVAIPHIIIHRYLRLTPAMVMIYLVVITFFIHLGTGPIWVLNADNASGVCKTYWWKFLLYIQNYTQDMSEICLIQTWYLSADMQMFILSPIILIPLSLQLKKVGFNIIMVEMLVFYTIWISLIMASKFIFPDDTNYFDSQTRFLNYCIGLWLGLFMRVKINEPFLYVVNEARRYIVNLASWVVAILGLLAVVVCYQDENLHHAFNSRTVYFVLMRPAWSVGLSWITYACYHGQGGFINWILCRPIFQILGRLTYCIYLVHITVITYYAGTVRNKWYFTDYNAFYQFCGHYVVSVIIATFWTLAFESPLITIEKHLLGGARQPKERKTEQNGNKEQPA